MRLARRPPEEGSATPLGGMEDTSALEREREREEWRKGMFLAVFVHKRTKERGRGNGWADGRMNE